MNKINVLAAIENTLNGIRCAGESDLDGMLGCIRGVRQVRRELEQEAADRKKEAEEHESA